METTEYAVRYTGHRHGKTQILTDTMANPTDRGQAEQVRDHIREWQEENGVEVDAELVTRTVTVTEWAAEVRTYTGREMFILAAAGPARVKEEGIDAILAAAVSTDEKA